MHPHSGTLPGPRASRAPLHATSADDRTELVEPAETPRFLSAELPDEVDCGDSSHSLVWFVK
jgi:hypothetical protein